MSGGNGSSSTSSGIENVSSIRHTGENDQSKSIEQPVLPKSISQIGGKTKANYLIEFVSKYNIYIYIYIYIYTYI